MVLSRAKLGAAVGGLLAAAVLAWVLVGDDEGAGASCGSVPETALTPLGKGPAAFTMGLRVNRAEDVGDIEKALGSRVLSRDVFVINTEFSGSDSRSWSQSVAEVRSHYPCNRIAALNGLGTEPGKPGYAAALAGEPGVEAILLDWEPDTWAAAGPGAWSMDLEANLPRIEARMRSVSGRLDGDEVHLGLVPDYIPAWDYGRTGRVVAEVNRRLDPQHRGFQVVLTQPNCGTPSAPGPLIGPLTAGLRRQYEPLRELVSTEHLGFEIAFDTDPRSGASETVERIGPEQAAACSREVLAAGGAGIVYWASPSALAAMLDTSAGRELRP